MTQYTAFSEPVKFFDQHLAKMLEMIRSGKEYKLGEIASLVKDDVPEDLKTANDNERNYL